MSKLRLRAQAGRKTAALNLGYIILSLMYTLASFNGGHVRTRDDIDQGVSSRRDASWANDLPLLSRREMGTCLDNEAPF